MTDIKGNTFLLGTVQTRLMLEEKGNNTLGHKPVQEMIILRFRVHCRATVNPRMLHCRCYDLCDLQLLLLNTQFILPTSDHTEPKLAYFRAISVLRTDKEAWKRVEFKYLLYFHLCFWVSTKKIFCDFKTLGLVLFKLLCAWVIQDRLNNASLS